ncbi:hypothetical protein K474DRAFT_1667686 [Panus rudis PR-1116 ss-1]|nr:hypothetical protein K474DRAFT_1667686 [Panus rudis PR-1116 ss-1]
MSTPPPSQNLAEPSSGPSAKQAGGVQNSPLVQQATKNQVDAKLFLQRHLSHLPQEIKKTMKTRSMRALLDAVTSCTTEADMYKPTEQLLNEISGIMYGYSKKVTNEEAHGAADSDESSSDECNDDPKDVDWNKAAKWRRMSAASGPSTSTRMTRSRKKALDATNTLNNAPPTGSKTQATASKAISRNTQKKTGLKRLTFLDHHDGPTAYHPDASGDKADLIAVWGELSEYEKYRTGQNGSYLKVPSYKVNSIIELKPQRGKGSGASQAISYLWDHRTARPDMPGVYALYANLKGYQIIWADAAGPRITTTIAWSDFELELLFAYVYSIYKPPKGHHIFDPTIQPSPFPVAGVEVEKQITYTITIPDSAAEGGEDRVYYDCLPVYWGPTFGRRTTVFLSQPENLDDLTVIKDSFSSDGRRFKEIQLLERAHGDGIVPGVVRLRNEDGKDHILVDGEPISTAYRGEDDKKHRTLDRLEMRSFGQPFSRAKSLLDLLKATYDVLEAHRHLVLHRGVLHRDLSIYNVLMYPQHGKKNHEEDVYVEDPPYFIEEVLDPQSGRTSGHAFKDRCRGLLIDLDNGSELSEEAGKELTVKTGTPRYISRGVARHGLLTTDDAKIYTQMPKLSDRAYDAYYLAYGEDTYMKYDDRDGTIHGSRLPTTNHGLQPRIKADANRKKSLPSMDKAEVLARFTKMAPTKPTPLPKEPHGGPPAPSKPFCHRMDHDAESMFWVLFRCLLLARPLSVPEEEDTNVNTTAWQEFSRHTISHNNGNDSRAAFMTWDVAMFEKSLHPKLAHVAELLRELMVQVRPEYGYLDPPPPQEHLHEAMRRLLLEAIVRIHDNPEEDVELDPNRGRRLSEAKPAPAPTVTKRKAEDQPDYAQGSKRLHAARECVRSISYAQESESDPGM